MNYYISDLHLGHKNALTFDERPFENVDQMAHVIISAWNSKVAQDDDVYVIGDFQYRDEKSPEWYLNQLKGHKHLIIGNHDNLLICIFRSSGKLIPLKTVSPFPDVR